MSGCVRGLLSMFVAGIWLVAGAAWAESDSVPGPTEPLVIVTGSGQYEFQVEIADTLEERNQGLMYRRELAARGGMLFVFDPPQDVIMWMKNTFIPLDMLFLAEDGRITALARQTTPHSLERIFSGGAVRGVLEINGGLSDSLGLELGDIVRHPSFLPGD